MSCTFTLTTLSLANLVSVSPKTLLRGAALSALENRAGCNKSCGQQPAREVEHEDGHTQYHKSSNHDDCSNASETHGVLLVGFRG
jgi:hypothetical protein